MKEKCQLHFSGKKKLKEKNENVELSDDPGRYLCNYIYYCSLTKLCKANNASLFVHFPPLHITNHEQNLKFALSLIEILTQ